MGFLDDKKRRAALGFFLLLFPLSALLLILMALQDADALGWTHRVAFALPLCIVFAALCRSSLYMCRALPPSTTAVRTLIIAHGTAALGAAGLWQLLALGVTPLFPPDTQSALYARRPLLFGLGLTYYLLSVVFHYLVLSMKEQHAAEQRMIEAQALAREAELRALRAQLNPHFLFNALNSITALTTSEPERAREMTIMLSEFLRGSLAVGNQQTIPLGDELDLARHYLKIELTRFADRMTLTLDIGDDTNDAQVPPLLLQPLVENAVKHGVAGLVSDGWVRLTARRQEDQLRVVVENNYDPEAPRRTGSGHGLRIVEQRLATYYGERAVLRTRATQTDDEGWVHRAVLRLPAVVGEKDTP